MIVVIFEEEYDMKHSTMRNLAIGALVGLLATGVSAQQYRGDWWGHGHMGSGHMGSGGMHGWGWGQMNPGQQQRMQRHWTYMNQGVPGAYRGARSTVQRERVEVRPRVARHQRRAGRVWRRSELGIACGVCCPRFWRARSAAERVRQCRRADSR